MLKLFQLWFSCSSPTVKKGTKAWKITLQCKSKQNRVEQAVESWVRERWWIFWNWGSRGFHHISAKNWTWSSGKNSENFYLMFYEINFLPLLRQKKIHHLADTNIQNTLQTTKRYDLSYLEWQRVTVYSFTYLFIFDYLYCVLLCVCMYDVHVYCACLCMSIGMQVPWYACTCQDI